MTESNLRRGRVRRSLLAQLLGLLLLACCLAGCGDPSYDLRGPGPKKGDKVRTRETFSIQNATLTFHPLGGGPVSGRMDITERSEAEIEVREVSGREVTKFTERVISDTTTGNTSVGGKTDGATDHSPLEGEVIFHVRDGGTWKRHLSRPRPRSDDPGVDRGLAILEERDPSTKVPTPQQRKELDVRGSWESDEVLYPAGEVKPGHTWTVQGPALRRWLGEKFLSATGTASMTFEKVEEVEGEQRAVVRVDVQAAGRMLDQDNQEMSFELGASGTIRRSLATGIDRQGRLHGQVALTGMLPPDEGGLGMRMEIRGPVVVEITTTPVAASASAPSAQPSSRYANLVWSIVSIVKGAYDKHPVLGVLVVLLVVGLYAAWLRSQRR